MVGDLGDAVQDGRTRWPPWQPRQLDEDGGGRPARNTRGGGPGDTNGGRGRCHELTAPSGRDAKCRGSGCGPRGGGGMNYLLGRQLAPAGEGVLSRPLGDALEAVQAGRAGMNLSGPRSCGRHWRAKRHVPSLLGSCPNPIHCS